jgi:hypothetical protein
MKICGKSTTTLAAAILLLLAAGCGKDENPTAPVEPAPVLTWQRVLDGTDCENGMEVIALPSGGYVAAGGVSIDCASCVDYFLVKIDAEGELVWRKAFGGVAADYGRALTLTPDGGFLIAGSTYSFGVANSDVYFVKTDGEGNAQWENTYGGDKWETVHDVIATSDGGYAAAGWTSSFDAPGGSQGYLVKTDANGNLEWQKLYGGAIHDSFNGLVELVGGGYVLFGKTNSWGAGWDDFYLVRVDSDGDVIWENAYGGPGNDLGYDVVATSDGIVACGWAGGGDNCPGQFDVYLFKVDFEGNLLWENCYGGAGYDGCKMIAGTPDGGFVVCGHIQITGDGRSTGYLIKTDGSGNLLWEKTLGDFSADLEAVSTSSDGGLIIAGTWYDEQPGRTHLYLVKTDASGNAGAMLE